MNLTRVIDVPWCTLEGPPHHQHSDLHSGRCKGLRWIKRKAPRCEFEGLPTYFSSSCAGRFTDDLSDPWDFSPGPSTMAGQAFETWLENQGLELEHSDLRKYSKKIKLFERHLQEILSTKWNVLQWFIVNQYCINYPEIIIIATFTSLVCRIYMSCILSEKYEQIIYWHDFSFANLTSIAEVSSETFSQQCEVFSGCLLWLSIFSFEAMDVCFLKNMFLEWTERIYSFFCRFCSMNTSQYTILD